MEGLVSLPDYDIFAYLMIGVAVLAASDLIFGTNVFFKPRWNASNTTITVVAAYVIGQLIALGATTILENRIVLSVLERPVDYLTSSSPTSTPSRYARAFAMPSYFVPLHSNTLAQIKEKNKKNLTGDELFWEAYNTAKQDENAFDRITTFSRLYHFCRNMAFASLLGAILVLSVRIWRGWTNTPPVLNLMGLPGWLTKPRWQFVAFSIAGVLLYLRYLYYFRAHSIEMLTSYAYGK